MAPRGARVVVKLGERVPVDGVVVRGQTGLQQADASLRTSHV